MTVFVVILNDNDDFGNYDQVDAIFKTREGAKDYIKNKPYYSRDDYEIEEWDVLG